MAEPTSPSPPCSTPLLPRPLWFPTPTSALGSATQGCCTDHREKTKMFQAEAFRENGNVRRSLFSKLISHCGLRVTKKFMYHLRELPQNSKSGHVHKASSLPQSTNTSVRSQKFRVLFLVKRTQNDFKRAGQHATRARISHCHWGHTDLPLLPQWRDAPSSSPFKAPDAVRLL